MSATILEILEKESDRKILFTALEQYEKRCLGIANKEMQGYGKATEFAKKEEWRNRATEIRNLTAKISEELI